MRVNPRLLDDGRKRVETQPMVDKSREETFADRFERLRGGMSYEALSEAIHRKTGVQISAQALHKWSKGGKADAANLKAVADFFGVNEAWLSYGTGRDSQLSLDEVINALPPTEAEKTVDFIKYQLERAATETQLFAEDPARLTAYLKFIDRLMISRKGKQ
jgi:Tfp pilus assembly protein PilV